MSNFTIIKDNLVNLGLTRVNKIAPTDYSPDAQIATSQLGTPIYSNLIIKEGQYTDPVTGKIVKYPNLRVDTILFEVNRSKNMVMTEVQGRDSTVKEFIANKDYDINISGVLVSPLINVSPADAKAGLIAICNAKCSIEITSQFLNDFGIYNIVISNYRFAERQGVRNVIDFSLTCVSDLPFDVEIELERGID